MNICTKTILSLTTVLVSVNAMASAWNPNNSPGIFNVNYNYNYNQLPKEGSVPNDNIPWADSYWPKNRAGASYRWMEHSNENAKQNLTPAEAQALFFSYRLPTASELTRMSQSELAKLSPAEKYDIYNGDLNYPLTKRYRGETTMFKSRTKNSPKDAYWEGYCYAWTAVALSYGEPMPVVRNVNIKVNGQYTTIQLPFGSGDVKALLAMNYAEQLPGNPQIGTQCNKGFIFPATKTLNGVEMFADYGDTDGMLVSEFPEYLRKFQETAKRLRYPTSQGGPNPYSPTFVNDTIAAFNSPECQDTNAGAFHVMMANQLGILKKGFAIDKTADREVWNQPVFKFTTQEVGPVALSANHAADAVSAVQVKTSLYYADDTDYGFSFWEPTLRNLFTPDAKFLEEYNRYQRTIVKQGDADVVSNYPEDIISKAHYIYNIELNAQGKVVGGEWITFDRPDFAWMPRKEPFQGLFKNLGSIYEPIHMPTGAVPNYGSDE